MPFLSTVSSLSVAYRPFSIASFLSEIFHSLCCFAVSFLPSLHLQLLSVLFLFLSHPRALFLRSLGLCFLLILVLLFLCLVLISFSCHNHFHIRFVFWFQPLLLWFLFIAIEIVFVLCTYICVHISSSLRIFDRYLRVFSKTLYMHPFYLFYIFITCICLHNLICF